MTKSQYQMVHDFNVAFGVDIHSPFYPNLITQYPKLSQLRYQLIEEEVLELQEAIQNNDRKEIIDALADILYVAWGAGVSFGLSMDKEYRDYLILMRNPFSEYDFENKTMYENTLICVPTTNISKTNGLERLFDSLKMLKHCLHINQDLSDPDTEYYRNNFAKYLCRFIYQVYRFVEALDVDINRAFNIVHSSNMSKLCKTEEVAQKTVQWYKDNNTVYDSPAYRKSDLGDYYVVFNESTGKILKSIEYTPANFDAML
jgi:hypothetical protein